MPARVGLQLLLLLGEEELLLGFAGEVASVAGLAVGGALVVVALAGGVVVAAAAAPGAG